MVKCLIFRSFLILLVFCGILMPCFAQSTVATKSVTTTTKSAAIQKYPSLNTTLPMINPNISSPSPVEPQSIDFSSCAKSFRVDSKKLFYLTLASVNANRFKIDEIQSQSGYVIFTITQKQFLANVVSIDSQHSMLKITPCNNVYYFPIGIVQNMFKYIELNLNTPLEKLPVM